MNRMQLLEYIMLRLYVNHVTSREATIILLDKMGYTDKDMDQVDREIVSKEWPESDSPEQSMEHCNKRMMEYEMQ